MHSLGDRHIVPARLHRVATFESHAVYAEDGEGRMRISGDEKSIDQMVDEWVSRTGNLIVHCGPLQLSRIPMSSEGRRLYDEVRTLPVTYVPPVEESEQLHGEQGTHIPEEPGQPQFEPAQQPSEPSGGSSGGGEPKRRPGGGRLD